MNLAKRRAIEKDEAGAWKLKEGYELPEEKEITKETKEQKIKREKETKIHYTGPQDKFLTLLNKHSIKNAVIIYRLWDEYSQG